MKEVSTPIRECQPELLPTRSRFVETDLDARQYADRDVVHPRIRSIHREIHTLWTTRGRNGQCSARAWTVRRTSSLTSL